MPQNVTQLGDAFQAFIDWLEALEFASGHPLFRTVTFADASGDPQLKEILYPAAIVRISGGQLDDENGAKNHTFDVSVEIRAKIDRTSSGLSPLLGAHNSATSAQGAGMLDLIAKLASGADMVSPQDNSEVLSAFAYRGCGPLSDRGTYWSATCNFFAALNLV